MRTSSGKDQSPGIWDPDQTDEDCVLLSCGACLEEWGKNYPTEATQPQQWMMRFI